MVSEPIKSHAPVSAASSLNAEVAGCSASPRAFSRMRLRVCSIKDVFSGVRINSAPAPRASRISREAASMFGPISPACIHLHQGDLEVAHLALKLLAAMVELSLAARARKAHRTPPHACR